MPNRFYVIVKLEKKEWVTVSEFPDFYMRTRKVMLELRAENPKAKYRIIKATLEDCK